MVWIRQLLILCHKDTHCSQDDQSIQGQCEVGLSVSCLTMRIGLFFGIVNLQATKSP